MQLSIAELMTFAILLRGWYTWTCFLNFIFCYQNVNWWPKFGFTVVQDFICIYIKNSQFWYKHSISKLFVSIFLEINKVSKNDFSYKFTLKNTWPLEDRLHHFGFPAAKTPQYVLPKKAVRQKKTSNDSRNGKSFSVWCSSAEIIPT